MSRVGQELPTLPGAQAFTPPPPVLVFVFGGGCHIAQS